MTPGTEHEWSLLITLLAGCTLLGKRIALDGVIAEITSKARLSGMTNCTWKEKANYSAGPSLESFRWRQELLTKHIQLVLVYFRRVTQDQII